MRAAMLWAAWEGGDGNRYRQAGIAVWAIAVVVAVMDYISARVRERIV